jgi:predicted ATPase with chaperone activity
MLQIPQTPAQPLDGDSHRAPLTEPEAFAPPEPESLSETDLPESLIEQLILKILYYRGELFGQGLSTAIGLRFSVIQTVVEALTVHHQIQIKRSLGIGSFGSVFALTETGRGRAREYMEENQYGGAAPVTHAQYVKMVRRQRREEGWLGKAAVAKALRGMVVTERLIGQLGPAVSSGNSLLIYGKPGDGKTFLVESLTNLESPPIYVPHAIECQGHIIRVFDPVYHQRIEEDPQVEATISMEGSYDRRWVKCKRPFIVSGGELTLDMLDLRYNETSKVYEAPFQLKANNGIYLIDDFGRQRATPAEVFNRWIVPMERRVDYLSFLTGGKMTAPFEAFLVFSTNMNPADLGDEAFLRRIQYKLLLHGPSEEEFEKIFENCCAARGIPFPREVLGGFIEKRYRRAGRPLRRCHPRDLLSHALNLIHFEQLPLELTEGILDRAFESCFLQEGSD